MILFIYLIHFTIPTDKIHCHPHPLSPLSFWCMIYFKFSSFHPPKKHSIHLCSWREKLEKLRNLIITLTRRRGKKNFIFSTFFSSTILKQLWIFFRLFFSTWFSSSYFSHLDFHTDFFTLHLILWIPLEINFHIFFALHGCNPIRHLILSRNFVCYPSSRKTHSRSLHTFAKLSTLLFLFLLLRSFFFFDRNFPFAVRSTHLKKKH